MAISRCPKCEGTRFELKENGSVLGAKFKLMFVQCAACGAVVGVTDYFNVPAMLQKLGKKLGIELN